MVGTCLDGATALDLCRDAPARRRRARPPHAPGPHGLEVAQRLAVDAPDVRVIVFTNYQDPELVAEIRAAGATYLPKGNLRALRRAVVGDVRPR